MKEETKKQNKFLKFFKRIFILPVMPLIILYGIFSIYMFYKNSGIEFFITIEKENLGEELKGSQYEQFTRTYVIPVINILAVIAWFYIIKFFTNG